MKHDKVGHNATHVVDNLRRLPRKMLLLHEFDNVTEFVLHELCGKSCFNLDKAAYFIDNPDFNCIKGVVGVSNSEMHGINDIWSSPDLFTQYMIQSPFNQHVRSFTGQSHRKNNHSYEDAASAIAQELGFNSYGYYVWDMKHNNHGFLVCEKNDTHLHGHPGDDIVLDGLCLLSFCPVH
jgi:hypothetical protein